MKRAGHRRQSVNLYIPSGEHTPLRTRSPATSPCHPDRHQHGRAKYNERALSAESGIAVAEEVEPLDSSHADGGAGLRRALHKSPRARRRRLCNPTDIGGLSVRATKPLLKSTSPASQQYQWILDSPFMQAKSTLSYRFFFANSNTKAADSSYTLAVAIPESRHHPRVSQEHVVSFVTVQKEIRLHERVIGTTVAQRMIDKPLCPKFTTKDW